ncbi:MAG TPA: glycosyltransferase family 39 protein [Polyangiaceae bacterium]
MDAPAPAEQGHGRAALAATVAFVVLGIAFRAALAYPIHKYPADADCLNSGLVALRILDGRPQAFYTPRRLGALECYVHAAAFEVLGVGRPALAVAPFLSGSCALILWAWLALTLLGPVAGPIAVLLLALPPPAYAFWTYMPNTYPETMLLCVAILAGAVRLHRRADALGLALFGLAAGLGFWNSIQTLAATLPALLWLAASRRRELVRGRTAGLALAAFVVGALPWIAWNILIPFGSFHGNFSVRPATRASQVAGNLRYLATYSLPELTASLDPEGGPNPPSALRKALRPPVLALWAAAAVFGLMRAATWMRARLAGAKRPAPPDAVLLLAGGAVLLFATVSAAGLARGLTVRYVLPLHLTLAAALALLLAAVARRSRTAAAALGAMVLVFNVAGAFLPGTDARRLWEAKRQADEKLIAFLEEHQVDVVFGDYWVAYPVNFLSRERIRAVPFQEDADFYDIERRLPARPMRCGIVAGTRDELERLSRRASRSGVVTEVGLDSFVLIANGGATDPRAFLGRLRKAWAAGAEP